jgi:hypothetical protein
MVPIPTSELNAIGHLTIYFGLTLLYLAILRLLIPSQRKKNAFSRQQVILILTTWLLSSGVLMAVAPGGESHDIFDYLFRGRMITEYGANPLVDVPESYKIAPYYIYLAWRKNVDTYGPVWEIASAAVSGSVRQVTHWLGWWGESKPVCPLSPASCRLLTAYITGYRVLAISLTGLSGWLMARIVKHDRGSLAPLALATWLLNPLTLIATAVGAHNDTLMLILILSAWWSLQRQHPFLAMLALILAAHVKLTALIWLPVCVLWLVWERGWRRALQIGLMSAAIGLMLSWLLYAPFGGWQTLPRMLQERSEFLANSPWRILKFLVINQGGWRTTSAHQLSVGLPSLLFAAGALLIPVRMFLLHSGRWSSALVSLRDAQLRLWHALTAISMLYLLVGSFWFQHWYVLWALVPAAILPDSLFTRLILPWLTFGALCSNVAMDFLLAGVMKTSPPIVGYIFVVMIIWGPVLFAATALALIRKRERVRPGSTSPPVKLSNQ